MDKNKDIAVLVPCYNEELTIEKVVRDFKAELPEAKIYVYDNNSTDNTVQNALSEGAIIGREYIQGKANVIRRMFKEINADVYIMVDGDDTYPAKEVHKLLTPVLSGECSVVIGDRISNGTYGSENKRAFHGLGNNVVKFLINKFFKAHLKDIMTGYRVFDKCFVKNYPVLCKGFELETEMSIFALNNYFTIKEIPIDFQERPDGSESKLNTFRDGFRVILTIFNLFRHYKPFLFFGTISILFLAMSFLVGMPVIMEYVKYSYIYKVPSAILASSMVVVAILSFVVGLILDTIAINDKKNFQLCLNGFFSKN